MYKRVLVTLDGSPLAESILPIVSPIAGPMDLEVVLFRVLQPPVVPAMADAVPMIEDVEERIAEAREYLAPLAAELAARGIRVKAEVRRGDPVQEILAAAREFDSDLIAMTTHGRSGLGRLLFGSVAEAVLRRSDIPVLMIRLTEKQVQAGGPSRSAR
jgi:nucleotide-binding universal stress UspA family protein